MSICFNNARLGDSPQRGSTLPAVKAHLFFLGFAGSPRWLFLQMTFAVLLLISGCTASIKDMHSKNATSSTPSLNIPTDSHAEKLILFVHGWNGDSSLSWKNEKGVSWLDMMKQDSAFRDFAIGTIGYETPLISESSGIEEVATRLYRQIEDASVFQKYKEIYLITHSMGGLVAKRILVTLNRPHEVKKLRKIKAILYISTPAQGANIAEIGSWLNLNRQLCDMRPADFNSYLQSVENQWQDVIRDRDRDIEKFPLSFCAYETKPTYGIHIVSRVYSATFCDQNAHPVDADHIDIVKPIDQKADIYIWVSKRIEQAGKNASEAVTWPSNSLQETTPNGNANKKRVFKHSDGKLEKSGDSYIQSY